MTKIEAFKLEELDACFSGHCMLLRGIKRASGNIFVYLITKEDAGKYRIKTPEGNKDFRSFGGALEYCKGKYIVFSEPIGCSDTTATIFSDYEAARKYAAERISQKIKELNHEAAELLDYLNSLSMVVNNEQ